MSSNPFFAFHDDVFPAFAKTAVTQENFPLSGSSISRPYPRIIVPDNAFKSLKEFKHISTIELKLRGIDRFKLQINSQDNEKEGEILECKLFNGKTIFSFGAFKNGSFWVDSDFFAMRKVLSFAPSTSKKFEFKVDSKFESRSFKISDEKGVNKEEESIEMDGLENLEDRRIRVYKIDRNAEIKNFIYFPEESMQFTVLLSFYQGCHLPYKLYGDGTIDQNMRIEHSSDFTDSLSIYISRAKHALVKNKVHIFGGEISGKRVVNT